MTLQHTPAYMTHHPDTFLDPETGSGYEVFPDTDAENPLSWVPARRAGLYAYRTPVLGDSVLAERPEGNVALDAFARFYESHDETRSLELTRRYLAAFHPEKHLSVETGTIRGYAQGDWLGVVAATVDGYGTPAGLMETVRRWAFGDVWVVCDDLGGGLSGIYAEDQEEAIAHYRAQVENECETAFTGSGGYDELTFTTTAQPETKAERRAFADWQREVADPGTTMSFQEWITRQRTGD